MIIQRQQLGKGQPTVLTNLHDDHVIAIIRDEMIREMDIGFDHVDKILDETRSSGLSGAIMHSLEKLVFTYFARDSVRGKTMNQMDIIFATAIEFKNGMPMQELGRKHFKEYLHNDETYHRCHKDHPRFKEIGEQIKQSFESRVKQTAEMLVKGKGNTYPELVHATFPSKEEASAFLSRELECVKNEIDILTSNPSLLKVPIAKNRILDIIMRGYDYARARLRENLDAIYAPRGPVASVF